MIFIHFNPSNQSEKIMELHPCPKCQFPCFGKQCKDCHFRMVFEKNQYRNCCVDCRNYIDSDYQHLRRCRNCYYSYMLKNKVKCNFFLCKNVFDGRTAGDGKKKSYCNDCFSYLKSKNECFCEDCSSVLYFNFEKDKNKCKTCIRKKKINMKTKSLDKKKFNSSKCMGCNKNGHVLYCKDCFNHRLFSSKLI